LEAEIILEYDSKKIAQAIADAVSPDNAGTPVGLSVKTRIEKKKVVTLIRCRQGFSTFVATIDDLLFSITTAEKTLREFRLEKSMGIPENSGKSGTP
jgi:tRNA threonylcarbamoyladenosine modification (KEOPS) complex  Pcc1 subunit